MSWTHEDVATWMLSSRPEKKCHRSIIGDQECERVAAEGSLYLKERERERIHSFVQQHKVKSCEREWMRESDRLSPVCEAQINHWHYLLYIQPEREHTTHEYCGVFLKANEMESDLLKNSNKNERKFMKRESERERDGNNKNWDKNLYIHTFLALFLPLAFLRSHQKCFTLLLLFEWGVRSF
jgi:hypothetical protein